MKITGKQQVKKQITKTPKNRVCVCVCVHMYAYMDNGVFLDYFLPRY